MSVSNTWSDWDAGAMAPPPLPSFPARSAADTHAATAPQAAAPSAHLSRWSLVSTDGRATMRLPKRFVIGNGSCCDLRLSEQGVATHHAMLNVEDGVAYVSSMADAPTLLDGQAIESRRRLYRDAALTFGAASFRVEHDGPIAVMEEDVEEDVEEHDDVKVANEPMASRGSASVPHAPMSRETATAPRDDAPHPRPDDVQRVTTPHISAKADREVHFDRVAPRRRRGRKAWIGWLLLIGVIAAAWWWSPPDLVDALGWNPEAQVTSIAKSSAPVVAQVASPERRASPSAEVKSEIVETTSRAEVVPAVEPPATTLLDQAAALEAQGRRVSPPGQNAAALYVRALQEEPDSIAARNQLDKIVSAVAHDAGEMILRQRFDGARHSLEQLAAAVPERVRPLIGKEPRGQWRVMQLLLDADVLMQQYKLVGPDEPNAAGLLREALSIDPNNAIADEMLAKARGLQLEREKQF